MVPGGDGEKELDHPLSKLLYDFDELKIQPMFLKHLMSY
jgi:hypothetical protein